MIDLSKIDRKHDPCLKIIQRCGWTNFSSEENKCICWYFSNLCCYSWVDTRLKTLQTLTYESPRRLMCKQLNVGTITRWLFNSNRNNEMIFEESFEIFHFVSCFNILECNNMMYTWTTCWSKVNGEGAKEWSVFLLK